MPDKTQGGLKHSSRQPDIVIHTAEGAIIGQLKSLTGPTATEDVIARLLKNGPIPAKSPRHKTSVAKPVEDN